MMHQSQEPMRVEERRGEVPAKLAAIVRRMMAKSPDERFQTPGAAAAALGALLKGKGDERSEPMRTRVLPPPLPQPAPPTVAERPKPVPVAELVPPTAAPVKAGPMWMGVAIGVALAMVLGCLGLLVVPLLKPGEKVADRDGVLVKPVDKDKPKVGEGKLGDKFENDLGMKFVRIPAGKFMMGATKVEDADATADEGPRHEVEITKDFWMGVHVVTQGQYRAVMGYNPSYFSHDGKFAPEGGRYIFSPADGKGKVKEFTQKQLDDFPVENVSWQDAQDYLKKLNARPNKEKIRVEYRLPSEAEWEYSCRNSGMYQKYHFGDTISDKQANFGYNLNRTSKVGSYPANARGLYDMHGNVWQWCEDWHDDKYYANSPRRDPPGPPEGEYRVLRGGCWDFSGQFCRSARRYMVAPTGRYPDWGIRVALVPAS